MSQRILAIDDEPDILRLLERIIKEKTPYDIKICSNSLEVPNILGQESFDIIITDLKMPGLDGLDILKYVKENKRFEQVIMITAFGTLDTAMEALANGIFDYITKPFKKELIIFTLDKAMRYQRTIKEYSMLKSLFDIEPIEIAVEEFKKIYLQSRKR